MNKSKLKRTTRQLQAERADKAEAKLAEWIKKAGIAVGKIREYTKKVAYYRKVLAIPKPKTPSRAIRHFDWSDS